MYSKIQKTFRAAENKQYFIDNEYVYNDSIKQTLEEFEDGNNSAEFFANTFGKLDGILNKNSKFYSQLKHLCYELSQSLTNSGKIIHKIAELYDLSIKEEEQTYHKMKFKIDKDVDNINKKLKIGLTEWGSQMIAQSQFVIDNIAGYFHYKKHENISFSGLIAAKMNINNNFIKVSNELDSKKQKLFDGKNVEKWKVNFAAVPGDFNEFAKDFNKIKPYMLPDVL